MSIGGRFTRRLRRSGEGREEENDEENDNNNNNNSDGRRKSIEKKQKRMEKRMIKKQRKTMQKMHSQRVQKMERSANSVRAISGFASGSMRLLPNKNGKKPISTRANVQWMLLGVLVLGVVRQMAENAVVAKKSKKTNTNAITSEKTTKTHTEESESNGKKEKNTNGTLKFAAMMATFIFKPVTVTGAFVLREVYRSALALIGETGEDSVKSSNSSVLLTPPLSPKTPRSSSRRSVSDEEIDEEGKSESGSSENKCCSNCGVKITNVLRCARCRQTCYCSQECQKSEWNEHKKTCVPSPELLENTRRANEEMCKATVNWDGTFQASTTLLQAVKQLTNCAKRCGDAKSSGDALWVSLIMFANEIDAYGEIKRKDGWRDVSFEQHLETCEEAARIVMRSEFLDSTSSHNEGVDENIDAEQVVKVRKARARALAHLALGTCALRGGKRSTKIALENFYDAREDAVKSKCPFLAAEACRRICFAHACTGNFSSASIAIQQAVEFAKLVAEKKKKENTTSTTMYYYYRLFHADVHESLEVCVLLEKLKISREYFGKNNITPREPTERAHFLAKDDSYHEGKKSSNLKTVAIGEALLRHEDLQRHFDDAKSARVKQTVYLILAETYHELEDTKKCEEYVQKIQSEGAAESDFKCAYCDECVVFSAGEDKEEKSQGISILPWQMEYRECTNPCSPHVFHTKCAHGFNAPHRKKHESSACCQQCVKEKNFDF